MEGGLLVDTNVTVPVNRLPLIDVDGLTIRTDIAFNQAGLDLRWNFLTRSGVQTQVAVTPTNTGGDYDWTHKGGGLFNIEVPATGGASANNDTEGFGWFTGTATGILPFAGPIILFGNPNVINSLFGPASTLLDVNVAEVGGATATAQNIADTYQAKITMTDDDAGTSDRYVVIWFKNGEPLFSGITDTELQVIKIVDGTDLIAQDTMTEIGSTQMFKYEESTNRIIDGDGYIAIATATIDGDTRIWPQQISRDG
jgi:hypothetical protein